MKRCKHENADHVLAGQFTMLSDGTIVDALVEQLRCIDCGAWLSLGEANDGGEHAASVAVEVRAAEIADNWREQSYRPGCDRFEWCPQNKSDELCDLCQAHVLAHDIAEHTEES